MPRRSLDTSKTGKHLRAKALALCLLLLLLSACISPVLQAETLAPTPNPSKSAVQPPDPNNKQARHDDFLSMLIPEGADYLFNPFLAQSKVDKAITSLLYLPLCSLSKDGSLRPVLLEDWQWSNGERDLELRLKPELCWQNGQAITSKDVEFTLLSALEGGPKNSYYSLLLQLRGAQEALAEKATTQARLTKLAGIRCLDDQRLLLHFNQAAASLWPKLAPLAIVPYHRWGLLDISLWPEELSYLHHPTASGPYDLQKLLLGNEVFLKAHTVKGLPSPKIPFFKISIAPKADMLTRLMELPYNVALLEQVSSADKALLEAKSYQLDLVPTDELIAIYALTDKLDQSHYLHTVEGRSAISALLPLQQIKSELFHDQAFLPAELALTTVEPFSKEAEERGWPEEAETVLDQLLAAAWLSPKTEQEKIQAVSKLPNPPELRYCLGLTLAYDSTDADLTAMASSIQASFAEQGLVLYLLALGEGAFKDVASLGQLADLWLCRQDRRALALPLPCRPLLVPAVYYAWRDLKGFAPVDSNAFADICEWELNPGPKS